MKSIGIAAAVFAFATLSFAGAADVVTTTDGNTKVTMLNARDMMIQAASAPASIDLHFVGAERIDFGSVGELTIIKNNGKLVRYRPDVYQMIGGKLRAVGVTYRVNGKDRVTMKFGKFDKESPLIIHRGAATL